MGPAEEENIFTLQITHSWLSLNCFLPPMICALQEPNEQQHIPLLFEYVALFVYTKTPTALCSSKCSLEKSRNHDSS